MPHSSLSIQLWQVSWWRFDGSVFAETTLKRISHSCHGCWIIFSDSSQPPSDNNIAHLACITCRSHSWWRKTRIRGRHMGLAAEMRGNPYRRARGRPGRRGRPVTCWPCTGSESEKSETRHWLRLLAQYLVSKVVQKESLKIKISKIPIHFCVFAARFNDTYCKPRRCWSASE